MSIRTSTVGIMLLGAILTIAGTAMAALTGAIYTTEVVDGVCTGVDINLYESKLDVYVDGGPRHVGNGTQLPDGGGSNALMAIIGGILLLGGIGLGVYSFWFRR